MKTLCRRLLTCLQTFFFFFCHVFTLFYEQLRTNSFEMKTNIQVLEKTNLSWMANNARQSATH